MTEAVKKMLEQKLFDVEQNVVQARMEVNDLKMALDAAEERLRTVESLQQDIRTDLNMLPS